MSRLAKALALFVILFHIIIFVAEAFLWMRPAFYEVALNRLNGASVLALDEQALALKAVFVNLGFYNLFLAIAGITGFYFLGRRNAPVGFVLMRFMCFFAIGAGIVLAVSTTAYVGAFLQAVPAAFALVLMSRSNSISIAVK
jgi:putative membrane protein